MNSNEIGNLPDRILLAKTKAYQTHISTASGSLNLTSEDAGKMETKNEAFEAALDDWDAVELSEAEKAEAKKAARKVLLKEYRSQRNQAYADDDVTDESLAAADFPPRDHVKTASAAPSSAPIGWVDFGRRKHTIHFRDSASPDSEAKPKGIKGCQIYRFISETAPTSDEDFSWMVTDSDSPYVASYNLNMAGKKLWYMMRWISNGDELGEWSEMIEATING
jgi:hypothetical protein